MHQTIKISTWQQALYEPYRFKILAGGRGSGKSWAIADALVWLSFDTNGFIMCAREFQNSIKDSVHALLKARIKALELERYFTVTKSEIVNKISGATFFFVGLRLNIESIKSISNIKYVWLEEGETISRDSWEVLKPTIRESGSEIWASFNPKLEDGVLWQDFFVNKIYDNDSSIKVFTHHNTYLDNPFISQELLQEAEVQKANDYGMYRHIWLGEILKNSEQQIFHTPNHWIATEFEYDEKAYKYIGMDFGFGQDPFACVQMWVKQDGDRRSLYIWKEAVQHKLELDHIYDFCKDIMHDFDKWQIYADSADPIQISYLRRHHGLLIKAVEKGANSIENGINFMKGGFDKIYVHEENCPYTIKEFTDYSYKVDKQGVISNKPEDKNNHCIDAIRYGIEVLMKRNASAYSKIRYDLYTKN